MSDPTYNTEIIVRKYCPDCEPNADPLKKGDPLEVCWCEDHTPSRGGPDDINVTASSSFSTANTEAGGQNNRAMCNLIHGKNRERK